MQVLGLGNVTECNHSFIFLNNEGKQDRIKSNKDLLSDIYNTASVNISFYDRMYEELLEWHNKQKSVIEKKYHFITDEEIKEACAKDRKLGFDLDLRKQSNNEECIRQFSKVSGIFSGASLALDRKWEAYKLMKQVESSLQKFK